MTKNHHLDTTHRIIKALIESSDQPLTIRSISSMIERDYRIVYQKVQELYHENKIFITASGNTKLCSIIRKLTPEIFYVESFRRISLGSRPRLKVFIENIRKINIPFILLLFGSYAKKTATTRSDIDLLLISENEKEIIDELNLSTLPLHITSISYSDFVQMLYSREITVVSEALKRNIILNGIEDYYRIIENVRSKTD